MTRPPYYEILGVAATASAEQISRSYKRAIRRFEFDCTEATTSVFAPMIREAYDVLHDEGKRRDYDRGNGSIGDAPAPSQLPSGVADTQPAGGPDSTAQPDNWLFIGWWAYFTAVAFLATAGVAGVSGTPVIPGVDRLALVGVGLAAAGIALGGALVVTRTLRTQGGIAGAVVVVATVVFGTTLVGEADLRFLLPILFVWFLAGGSLIVAWRRHARRSVSAS